MASLVGDENAARIISAIIVSFCLGAFATILAIYAGANLRSQPATPVKEFPPRRVFVSEAQSGQTGSITTPGTTLQNQFEAPTQPIVLVENGLPHFLETPERRRNSTVIEWAEEDTKTGRMVYRQIDIQTLRRFARLHTPCRAEWSGRATAYSEGLAFFRFSGWLQQSTTANGVEWLMHYSKLQRRLTYLGDLADISQPA